MYQFDEKPLDGQTVMCYSNDGGHREFIYREKMDVFEFVKTYGILAFFTDVFELKAAIQRSEMMVDYKGWKNL